MKKLLFPGLLFLLITGHLHAQERFGNTLNVGAGVGYYGYAPSLNLNYEFDVFRNFTLAPFISVISYKNYTYTGNVDQPYTNTYYRETTIPMGLKASYYFDEWLHAGDRWDFYIGTSLGVAYRVTTYNGTRTVRSSSNPFYASMHIGSECHLTQTVGVYLDLSTGLSTFGLGFHF